MHINMISVKSWSLKIQILVSKMMPSSSNLILKFRIVTSHGQIHRENSQRFKTKNILVFFRLRK